MSEEGQHCVLEIQAIAVLEDQSTPVVDEAFVAAETFITLGVVAAEAGLRGNVAKKYSGAVGVLAPGGTIIGCEDEAEAGDGCQAESAVNVHDASRVGIV